MSSIIDKLSEEVFLSEELKKYDDEFFTKTNLVKHQKEYYKYLGTGKDLLGLETGFDKLTKILSGLRGLIILAGEPKTGKTSFILQISNYIGIKGYPVIFYSFELTKYQLITRTLSNFSELPYLDILKKGRLYLDNSFRSNIIKENNLFTEEEQIALIGAERKRLSIKNFYIRTLEDEIPVNIDNIEKEIKIAKAKSGSDKILIIIDHLQLFPYEGNFQDRIDKEGKIIMEFNKLQKKTDSTILLISQKRKESFNTSNKKNKKQEDKLVGVKGSVDIVYLASLILTLVNISEDSIELNIISRDTASGSIQYKKNMDIHTFEEI